MNKNISKSLADKTKPISLKKNVLIQELDKELLLYDLKRDRVFCLNETSLMVWNLCDGEKTIEDIRCEVSFQLNTQVNEDFIWLVLDKLKSEQLLTNHHEITINFNGLSRREVIKRVGLSTMAVLPLVLSIISPKAITAQSQVCQSSTFCYCADASCIQFGDVALLQTPCTNSDCSGGGGNNCQCVGRFFCSNPGERYGTCGLV